MKIFLGFIIIMSIVVGFFVIHKKGLKPNKNSWIHLSIMFKDYKNTSIQLGDGAIQNRPTGIYKDLLFYLKKIVDSSSGLINRYFFLFEESPHLFFALEVKDMKNIEVIKNKISQIEKPNFIDSVKIDLNMEDENNGESAIDFFYAGTKYAFFRIGASYKPIYENNDEVKLVHSFSNQLFVNLNNEIKFYFKCLEHRGVHIQIPNDKTSDERNSMDRTN